MLIKSSIVELLGLFLKPALWKLQSQHSWMCSLSICYVTCSIDMSFSYSKARSFLPEGQLLVFHCGKLCTNNDRTAHTPRSVSWTKWSLLHWSSFPRVHLNPFKFFPLNFCDHNIPRIITRHLWVCVGHGHATAMVRPASDPQSLITSGLADTLPFLACEA